MKYFSKLQKVLLCAGLVLIVAALLGAPKYWAYCEMQALKAEFARFVDVERWESGTTISIESFSNELDTADAARVKAAIQKLEFDGEHTTKRYIKRLYEGGNDFSVIRFFILQRKSHWAAYVYYAADYCIVDDFVVKNTDDLIRVLQDLQVKYLGS